MLKLSWFMGGAPNAGWFGYAPITGAAYNPGQGIDFWILSLQILGVASLAAAFNFIVTIVNMRAPGLSLMRLPLFTWMTLVTSILLVLAFPVITVALIELMFDRFFGTQLLRAVGGGEPAAVAAPVLDIRPPGGVHPDTACNGHSVGESLPTFAKQAAVRLPR